VIARIASRAALGLALLTAFAPVPALRAQQPAVPVTIVDAGPGFMARLLQAALAAPHQLVPSGDTTAVLPRGAFFPRTVIVLGRDATVASRVRGDVIVVDGDLYLRPGATIEGRAVAIGGLVVNSSLASVRDGRLSYPDETFLVTAAPGGGYELRYRELRTATPRSRFPLFAGLSIPTYDRINGLSLAVAPVFAFDTARLELQPGLTYRSHLGAIDPSLGARLQLGRRLRTELWAGRSTFTNDAWIYGDVLNSANALVFGRDMRNYHRGARVEARLLRRFEGARWEHEPYVGARWERAESVVRDIGATGGPWSLFGRSSEKGMRRPNPAIDDGRLGSALVGTRLRWEPGDIRALGTLESELGFSAPGDRRFVQTTADVRVEFPTFGTQSVRIEAHGVATSGGETPRQRFVHLGGSGTLRTLDLFEQRGDQLLFIDSRYIVPFDRPRLPLLGTPTLTLRHLVGAAGEDRLPGLEQEVGVRLGAGLLRADLLYNPGRDAMRVGIGFSFTR